MYARASVGRQSFLRNERESVLSYTGLTIALYFAAEGKRYDSITILSALKKPARLAAESFFKTTTNDVVIIFHITSAG